MTKMRLLPLVSAIACVRGFLPPAARCAPPALRADANDYERVQQTEEADMIADWEARQARRDGGARAADVASSFAENVRANVAGGSTAPSLLFVAGQAVLLLCLAAGGVPLVGGPIQAVAGPGLVVAGAGFIGAGLLELGPANLTPFATPVAGNELKTNGVFALSRHPIYAGLVVASAGFSVATVSFQRALVTGMLFLLLDSKSEYEEKKLREVHPAYRAYAQTTPKFFPRLFDFDDDDDDAAA